MGSEAYDTGLPSSRPTIAVIYLDLLLILRKRFYPMMKSVAVCVLQLPNQQLQQTVDATWTTSMHFSPNAEFPGVSE